MVYIRRLIDPPDFSLSPDEWPKTHERQTSQPHPPADRTDTIDLVRLRYVEAPAKDVVRHHGGNR